MCDVQSEDQGSTPDADLTFNVKLKPHEIEARKRLILPHSLHTCKYVISFTD